MCGYQRPPLPGIHGYLLAGGTRRGEGETQGFMKIVVDGDTKEILGAAILGTGGDEVIHCILDVMYAKAPYTTLQRAMHIHPTVSELVPTILGELQPLADVKAGAGSAA